MWLRLDLATAAQHGVQRTLRHALSGSQDRRLEFTAIYKHFVYAWL